jgi:hypothetical protein
MQAPTSGNELNFESLSSDSNMCLTPKADVLSPSMISLESYNGSPPPDNNKDDLDLMLQHEDFPMLLELAVNVKRARQGRGEKPSSFRALATSSLQPNEVLQAVARLQSKLLSQPHHKHTIPRGMYPITDCILDDSITTLQNELEALDQETVPPKTTSGGKKTTGSNKKEAIAIKFSKWQTDILMKWMIEHIDQPFPSQADLHFLMQQTGLTQTQVVNWTTNVRKRNRKATCQRGKKPHHFIDFLFLKQDREKRQHDEIEHSPAAHEHHHHHHYLPPPPPPPLAKTASPPYLSLQPPQVPFEPPHIQPPFQEEPLPVTQLPDADLMDDFASFWMDEPAMNSPMMEDWAQPPLLPSVTDDHDDNPSYKRRRTMSWDMDDMEDEDIHSWAAGLGLQIDL